MLAVTGSTAGENAVVNGMKREITSDPGYYALLRRWELIGMSPVVVSIGRIERGPVIETESIGIEIGLATGTEIATETATANVKGTEKGRGTGRGIRIGIKTGTGTGTGTETGTEIGKGKGTGRGTGTRTERGIGIGIGTGTETETETGNGIVTGEAGAQGTETTGESESETVSAIESAIESGVMRERSARGSSRLTGMCRDGEGAELAMASFPAQTPTCPLSSVVVDWRAFVNAVWPNLAAPGLLLCSWKTRARRKREIV
jgi:hypothetical protein